MWKPLEEGEGLISFDFARNLKVSSKSAMHYTCHDDLYPSSQGKNTNTVEMPLDLSLLLASKLPLTVVLIQQIGFGASIIAS